MTDPLRLRLAVCDGSSARARFTCHSIGWSVDGRHQRRVAAEPEESDFPRPFNASGQPGRS